MGCACSKPSAVEDSRESPNDVVTVQKVSRLNSSRKEEVIRLNTLIKQEDLRLNSLRRQGSTRSKAKSESLDIKVASFNKKPYVSTGTYGGEMPKKAVIADHPGKGSIPKAVEGEQVAAGWPNWLSAVAGEAIKGWLPRRADTFEKLEKIGQGTYSSVYKARDIIHDKLVALKRVRFDNLDMESVKFMAREILILRRLDHPNIIKLQGLITSSRSCSLYLVFEYMEHDLTGLASRPRVKFTEPQVKCYMQQLLRGLDYCHSHGVLHRDIKGSNLLIDDKGILKIADFGLASFFDPCNNDPLTSRVVTLWYRPPELLLGASHYGVAVDLWSTGCILAELYTGKPILPGKTEVEQLHKIFKLCGSPSEDYWRKLQLPRSTSFKPAHPYRRYVAEAFKDFPSAAVALVDTLLSIEPIRRGTAATALKSEFFTTKPFACDPSSLPKYPPSKEIDAKMRDGDRRQDKVGGKSHNADVEGRPSKENLDLNPKPELGASMLRRQSHSSSASRSELFNPRGGQPVSGFLVVPSKLTKATKEESKNSKRISHSGPLMPEPAWMKSGKELDDHNILSSKASLSSLSGLVATRIVMPEDHRDRAGPSHPEAINQVGRLSESVNESATRKQDWKRHTHRVADSYQIENEKTRSKEPAMQTRGPKGNKIYVSGPILGPSDNVDNMLKERDRQIQEFARQARHVKVHQATSTRPHLSSRGA